MRQLLKKQEPVQSGSLIFSMPITKEEKKKKFWNTVKDIFTIVVTALVNRRRKK